MNLVTALSGVMPGRPASLAAQGDARLPAATGEGDAAALTSKFARALSEAGAAGRPTHGAQGRGRDTASRPAAAASSLPHGARALAADDDPTAALPSASPDTGSDTTTDAAFGAASATPSGPALTGSPADAATLLAELQAQHPAQAAAPLRNEAAAPLSSETAAPLDDEASSDTMLPSAPKQLAAATAPRSAPAVPPVATTMAASDIAPAAGPVAPGTPEAVATRDEPQARQSQLQPQLQPPLQPQLQPPLQPQLQPPLQPQPLAIPVQAVAAGLRRDDPPADTRRMTAQAAGTTSPTSNQPPAAELQTALPTARPASSEEGPLPPIAAAGPAIEPTIVASSVTAPPLPTAAAVGPPPGLAAAPVTEARLSAPPGSAEFATQLGSQLTTFVRDGVQHARLHLNPEDMGPVTVQIRIDGQSAQVHMAAEHGLTRLALEQSMPMLAGSLREAGLTLSGGGVFEQPRQTRDQAGAPTAA
ncbi:MAG: flagellar hook-length control protein FliK, partial [Rubrivivax sp.]|nr:flagellar hook-length control protein FliK [Rubrivivax sp.]